MEVSDSDKLIMKKGEKEHYIMAQRYLQILIKHTQTSIEEPNAINPTIYET
jgi:hypothetical protein